MDQREFTAAVLRDFQESQGHGLSPSGKVSFRGVGFIQTADDVPGALINRLPALVLLDLLALVFLEKQRQRGGRGQHGQL